MKLNVGKEIATVQRMTVGQLRDRYADLFGEETPARNKQWLIKRIIWRVQSLAEGSLSQRAKTRAEELANEADIRRRPPLETPVTIHPPENDGPGDSRLPVPGTTISRQYKGELIEVRILADGFEYAGDRYKSLSAVAKQITGTHCNGFHFFRLGPKEGCS
jgi:hypothetical protein